jgi:hypothetical protein
MKDRAFWRYRIQLFLLFLCSGFISADPAIAQSSSVEFWPETDIWYRLNPSWRLSTFIPITKNVETKYREINYIFQADYAWGHTKGPFYKRMQDENRAQQMKVWLARVGFNEGMSLGDHGENYSEDMVLGEIHKRTPLIRSILMSHRLRTELRWVGHDPEFSYRIRYRLMAEKEFTSGRTSWVPYVNAEPFWDSRFQIINRVRAIAGVTFSRGPKLALEGNFTYQYDSRASVTNVYAMNIILHIFFETKRSVAKQ